MRAMNRIRELRKLRKLSAYDLADKVGTRQPTIHRLETGKMKLTVEWMKRIADALGVSPQDLIAPTVLDQASDDVIRHEPEDSLLRAAIAGSPRQAWKVVRPTLDYLGLKTGGILIVDTSRTSQETLKTGDIVVVQVFDVRDMSAPKTLLRQFLGPHLYTTNSSRGNPSPLDGKQIDVQIIGVVLPNSMH